MDDNPSLTKNNDCNDVEADIDIYKHVIHASSPDRSDTYSEKELINNSILNDASILEFSVTANSEEEKACRPITPDVNSKLQNNGETDDWATSCTTDKTLNFNSNLSEEVVLEDSEDGVSVQTSTATQNKCLDDSYVSLNSDVETHKVTQSKSDCELHIKGLEMQLTQAKADILALKNGMQRTTERLEGEKLLVREDLMGRLEHVLKQSEVANRDKEAMVMKYANAEKEVIVVRKQKELVERKLKELEKDKDILQGKIKMLSIEKSRICNTLDNKIQEHGIAIRNIDKLKEEINAKDIKIKWGQTKLLTEMEAYKESQAKLDRALSRICHHEEEIRTVRQEAEKLVKETKDGENTRANVLDKQLKEVKANLIMEKQKYGDVSNLYKQLKSENEALQSSHILLETEATTLRVKVSKYEMERQESEKLFESLRSEVKCAKQGAADLSQQLTNSAIYEEQLESERLRAEVAEQNSSDLQSALEEQYMEMTKCREKEAELLTFTQKLTDKNVSLQSQLTAVQGKARLLEVDHAEIRMELEELKTEKLKLEKDLNQMLRSQKEKEQKFDALLEVKTKEVTELKTKVSDLLNEIQVQRRKQVNAAKDTNREIQKLRRKLETLEKQQNISSDNISQSTDEDSSEQCHLHLENEESNTANSTQPSHSVSPHASLSQESRASSDTSLNALEGTALNGTMVSCKNTASAIHDLPQHLLIERIIKLQKTGIKKSEKLEFLEEHVSQLIAELKKKNKIIQHYVLKEEPGALSSAKSDSVKLEMMKHGGIMASLYGSVPKDDGMTLDLSLEINRKLQAVLEDTLLKNITLKENLNTLGDEVAKLAFQNQETSSKS